MQLSALLCTYRHHSAPLHIASLDPTLGSPPTLHCTSFPIPTPSNPALSPTPPPPQPQPQALSAPQKLVIDLSFSGLMTPGELKSLCQQLSYSYSTAVNAQQQLHLHLLGASGDIEETLQKQLPGHVHWSVTKSDKSFKDFFQVRQQQEEEEEAVVVALAVASTRSCSNSSKDSRWPSAHSHVTQSVIGGLPAVMRAVCMCYCACIFSSGCNISSSPLTAHCDSSTVCVPRLSSHRSFAAQPSINPGHHMQPHSSSSLQPPAHWHHIPQPSAASTCVSCLLLLLLSVAVRTV